MGAFETLCFKIATKKKTDGEQKRDPTGIKKEPYRNKKYENNPY